MTLQEVTDKITELGAEYIKQYNRVSTNICLGPEEFNLLYQEGRQQATIPDWHYKASPFFFRGTRVHLMSTPGIFVGTLI